MAFTGGSVFLDVVPSFKGVQQAITREAARWGKSGGQAYRESFEREVGKTDNAPVGPSTRSSSRQGADSGGAFADGFKRKVDTALRSLPPVSIGVATSAAEQEIKDLKADLLSLSDARVGVDIDGAAALAEVDRISARLRALGADSSSVQVKADTAAALAQLEAVASEARRLDGKNVEINVRADSTNLDSYTTRLGLLATAAAAVAPALLPVGAALGGLAASAGGLIAVGGGALATVAVGMQGIGEASTALENLDIANKLGDPDKIKQAAYAYKVAQENITPAGQAFVDFLHSAKPTLDLLQENAANALLPGLQTSLEALRPLLPTIQALLTTFGGAVGQVATQFAQLVAGPAFRPFFDYLTTAGGPILVRLGEAFGNIALAVVRLIVAAAPLTDVFVDALVSMTDEFARFAASQSFSDFIDYVIANMPLLSETFKALFGLVVALTQSMAPFAPVVLKIATAAADFVASLPPSVLSGIVLAVIALTVAFNVILPAIGAVVGIVAALAAVFGGVAAAVIPAVIVVVALLIAWFVNAYVTSETFRDRVNGAILAVYLWWQDQWNQIKTKIFEPLAKFFTETLPLAAVVFRTLLNASWKSVQDFFGAGFAWIRDNVFTPLATFVTETVPGAFDRGVSAIAGIWDRLKAAVREPVSFVVDTIINNGLIDGFNGLIDKLKLPAGLRIGRLPSIAMAASSAAGSRSTSRDRRFARGGEVWGAGTATSDSIPAMLSNGEFVMKAASVKKYGLGIMHALNSGAAAFASGGLVDFGRLLQAKGARVSEHPAFGRVGTHSRGSLHYSGNAIDVNTRPGTSAAEQRELAPLAALARANGFRTIFQTSGHYDHLHVDTGGGKSLGAGGILGAAFGGFLGKLFDTGSGALSSIVDGLAGRAGESLPAQMAVGAAKALAANAGNVLTNLFSASEDGGAGAPGGGAEKWRGTVLQALSIMRQPASLANTVLRRLQQESGGNARAINNWDVNAKRGTPSKGLMQVIDPTFRSNAAPGYGSNIYDPLSNILASMRYALRRYGSLPAAYNRTGGYAQGGLVRPLAYDSGGYLQPGLTQVYNGTGRPEPVFTSAQFSDMQRGRSVGDGPLVSIGTINARDERAAAREIDMRFRNAAATNQLNGLVF